MSDEARGKVVVVTGASSGIGAAAAQELARRGAHVTPVGRDARRLKGVAERVGAEPLQADFASLDDVRRLADELLARHDRIDVLINNAGLLAGRRELTSDGYETTFAVNHLAPFLLTNLLLERMRESAPARIVTTSSDAHHSGRIDLEDLNGERSWSPWRSYASSKLANVLFTRALARRLDPDDVVANCLHPGVIRTRLGRGASPVSIGWTLAKPFFASPKRGAGTLVYLAVDPEAGDYTGLYFRDRRITPPAREAADDELGERLWRASEQMVALEPR